MVGWILGPTFAGEYPKDDPIRGHPSGYLRRNFSLFANVRPVRTWAQLDPLIPDLDITILRENTEGFYPDRNFAWGYGEFKPIEDVGLSLRAITAPACDRFARLAFEYCPRSRIRGPWRARGAPCGGAQQPNLDRIMQRGSTSISCSCRW
jgi:3-isopropylmalate dehydrogenase